MTHVFISSVDADALLALAVSDRLRAAGYITWHYKHQEVPGANFLQAIGKAIDTSDIVLVLITPSTLASEHVDREIVEALNARKHFLPVLVGISYDELRLRRREWAIAFGATASLLLAPEAMAQAVSHITQALQALGVAPNGTAHAIGDLSPPALGPLESPPRVSPWFVWPVASAGVESPTLASLAPHVDTALLATHGSDAGQRAGELGAGPYRLARQLDGGGESLVWLAEHVSTGAHAVLKIQAPGAPPEWLSRETAVLYALQQMNVPHVVRLLSCREDGLITNMPGLMSNWRGEPRLFCALEVLPSGPDQNLVKRGPMRAADVLATCDSLRLPLRALHADLQTLHNDLKPENLVAWRNARNAPLRVRLLDFGQAVRMSRVGPTGSPCLLPSLDARHVYEFGAWPYFAPERWDEGPVDVRSDQWSLAATVFELLTGQRLVPGQGKPSCQEEVRSGAYLRRLQTAKLPAAAKGALSKALALNPPDRFIDTPSATGIDAFCAALEKAF